LIYIRASTQALTDSKFLVTGPNGFTLYFKGLMYSKEHLLDGFVPHEAVALIGIGIPNVDAVIRSMIDVDLWRETEGGFTVTFERWSAYQTTKAEVEANREATRERVAKYRASRSREVAGNARVTLLHGGCNGDGNSPVTEMYMASSTKPKRECKEEPNGSIAAGCEKTGSGRFAKPTSDEVAAYMSERGWDDPDSQARKFCDFYASLSRASWAAWRLASRRSRINSARCRLTCFFEFRLSLVAIGVNPARDQPSALQSSNHFLDLLAHVFGQIVGKPTASSAIRFLSFCGGGHAITVNQNITLCKRTQSIVDVRIGDGVCGGRPRSVFHRFRRRTRSKTTAAPNTMATHARKTANDNKMLPPASVVCPFTMARICRRWSR